MSIERGCDSRRPLRGVRPEAEKEMRGYDQERPLQVPSLAVSSTSRREVHVVFPAFNEEASLLSLL
jgi:hypothetical protein